MPRSAMTLSKECVLEAQSVDTHMTSTPSSTTHAIPVKATMQHSCAMTTASTYHSSDKLTQNNTAHTVMNPRCMNTLG